MNLNRLLHIMIASISMVTAACNARPAPSPPPPPPPPSSSSPAPSPAPLAVSAAHDGPLSLHERLAREAASRPSGAIATETVAAALSSGGVPIGALKQVLARPLGARYCALARTTAGLVVSVCEFEDDAAAARGADRSRQTFDRLIPGRRLTHKRGTLLTLAVGTPDPSRAAEAARAESVFSSL